MRYIFVCWLLTLAMTAYAENPSNSCDSLKATQQCEQILQEDLKQDAQLAKLFDMRAGLCSMVGSGKLDLQTAKTIWGQTLAETLMQEAQKLDKKRASLRLYATF